MRPANRLRALIAARLLEIALIGVVVRFEPWVNGSWVAYWFFSAVVLAFFPIFFIFPILAYRAAIRANLPGWKLRLVIGVEAALAFALVVAITPGYQ